MAILIAHSVPILAGIWGASEVLLMLFRRSAPGSSQDRNSLRLIWLADFVGIFGAIYAARRLDRWMFLAHENFLLAALVIFAIGIVLRVYSISWLGKFFTANVAIAADHELIDNGPYRLVRHPSYTGALLTFLGFGLSFGNIASLLILLVPVCAAFLWRIHVEEQALLGAFGERYRAYMKKTKRLVPGIY
jgi:protein-S-isoprenylcysteine O-methyltransferase Ste14